MTEKDLLNPRVIVAVIIATIIIVSLLVAEQPPTVPDETAAPVKIPAAAQNAGVIDPGAITAWQRAATNRGMDLDIYNPVYLQDKNFYTVLLIPKDATDAQPAYQILVERGSHRIMGFTGN